MVTGADPVEALGPEAEATQPAGAEPHLAEVVGTDLQVPLVGGGAARYVNLDYAASAPALTGVWAAVQAFLPWYSSVHRGAGFRSQVATAAYERARGVVRDFLGGRPDDTVIFTRNTTDAINLLARCLPRRTTVVTTLVEHHANLLPWGRVATRRYVECDRQGTFGVDDVDGDRPTGVHLEVHGR